MSTTAVLIDHLPAYLNGQVGPASLLLASIGPGTLLTHWRDRLLATEIDDIVVVPQFQSDGQYEQAIKCEVADARLMHRNEIRNLLQALESADRLLITDTRYFPTDGFDLGQLLSLDDPRVAAHMTRLRRRGVGPRERVLLDRELRVRGIERLYAGVTDLDVLGVVCSTFSVAAARRVNEASWPCLEELRSALAAGGVPTRDFPVVSPLIDLELEDGLLNLNERMLDRCGEMPMPRSFRQLAPDIWISPGCRIHPASRLYSPVILQRDVRIDAGALLIGPVVVGAGAYVGADAVLSRCVVNSRARVSPAARVANRVLAAGTNGKTKQGSGDWAQPLAEDPQSVAADASGTSSRMTAARGSRAYSICKRLFDTVAALCGLIVLSPMLLVVALLIKLTSAGPVLFGHEREGRDGKAFRCWKFRTMSHRAHAQQRQLYAQNQVDGPQFKLSQDPRITPIGHVLRRTNIDELPQLLNVVRGDMSLIGPRPSPFRENQICVPWRRARLSVRPGLTGLWQVCRHERAAGDFHQWIYFDVLYARHRSFSLDMRILLATFLTLGGRWSVPLSWTIPHSHAERDARGVATMPVLNNSQLSRRRSKHRRAERRALSGAVQ
jgi:lipopolysaccharide/colanic/teichoic acid biosynthesis glycosyltransferase